MRKVFLGLVVVGLLLLYTTGCQVVDKEETPTTKEDTEEADVEDAEDEDEEGDVDENDEDEDDEDKDEDDKDKDDKDDDAVAGSDGSADSETTGYITIDMVAKNFSFTPNTISAKVGQEITVKVQNTGTHDFVIDELGVSYKFTEGANTFTFRPDKAGTFKFYCSVGKHRQMGMEGTLTVSK